MKSRLSARDNEMLHRLCETSSEVPMLDGRAFAGRVSSLIEELDAEVRDLKARLKAIRAAWLAPCVVEDRYVVLDNATNLRVRNWRKP